MVYPSLRMSMTQGDTTKCFAENIRQHHTERYADTRRDPCKKCPEKTQLVLRRGQEFNIKQYYCRAFDPESDYLQISMFVSDPRVFAGNGNDHRFDGIFPVTDKATFDHMDPRAWAACYNMEAYGKELTITVRIPGGICIGEWTLRLCSYLVGEDPPPGYRRKCDYEEQMYILFNPWSPFDVHVASTDESDLEKVLEDSGAISVGTYWQPRDRNWIYGQFEPDILKICLYVLDVLQCAVDKLSTDFRTDPTHIVWALKHHMIYSMQSEGILEVMYDPTGTYKGGTAPSLWTGSPGILREWARTGKRVQYGQCWVVSAVFSTICRCLGIPTRCVTCFPYLDAPIEESGRVTMMQYWSYRNHSMEPDNHHEQNVGKLWSFHVWNEIFLSRRFDLEVGLSADPERFRGWQVVDSHPTYLPGNPGGLYPGPIPVTAIRGKDLAVNYHPNLIRGQLGVKDEAQLFNQLVVDPRKSCYEQYQAPPGLTDVAGLNLITVTRNKRWTKQESGLVGFTTEAMAKRLTPLYKNPPPETSLYGSTEILYSKKAIFRASLKYPAEQAIIGEPISAALQLTNLIDRNVGVELSIALLGITYNGIETGRFTFTAKGKLLLNFAPGKTSRLPIEVSYEDYRLIMTEHYTFKICVVMALEIEGLEKRREYGVLQDFYRLILPRLLVEKLEPIDFENEQRGQLDNSIFVGKPFKLRISFENPLPRRLTACNLALEAPRIQNHLRINPFSVDASHPFCLEEYGAGPKSCFTVDVSLVPRARGQSTIVVVFNSDSVRDVTSSLSIYVC